MVLDELEKKLGSKAAALFGFNHDGTKISEVGRKKYGEVETPSGSKRQVEQYAEKKHDSSDFLWGLGFLIVGIFFIFFGIVGAGPVLSGPLLIMGVPLLFFGLVGLYFFIFGKYKKLKFFKY